jgi:hypothetical protein
LTGVDDCQIIAVAGGEPPWRDVDPEPHTPPRSGECLRLRRPHLRPGASS